MHVLGTWPPNLSYYKLFGGILYTTLVAVTSYFPLAHNQLREELYSVTTWSTLHSPTYSGQNSSGITDSIRNFWTLGVIFFGVFITVRG